MRGALSFFSAWLLAGFTLAQDAPPSNGPLPGHSMHGESFNEGPRQKAYRMEGMAAVHFPVTSRVAGVQEFFNQGISQLHGFWYFEAERTFRQVASLDPECAMAYWGMSMANVKNEKRAKELIKVAVQKKGTASDREKLWIDSLAAYYDGKGNNRQKRRELIRALEKIVQDYPEDIEAKAFLAYQIWDNSMHDLAITSHQAVDTLIEEIFRVQPSHPAHHYRIHLWDNEKAERALRSAALCGQSAPGIAHMWHMSGHIFSKLHRYPEATWQQEASARVDHAHMMRDRILPDQIHNYAHNNEWLVRNLMFIGRVRDAMALAMNLIELPRHPKYNTLTGNGSASFGRSRLLDLLYRFELWDEAIRLADTPYLDEPTEDLEEKLKRLRLLGVAWYSKGDRKQGDRLVEQVREMIAERKKERQADADKAEAKAKEEKKSEADVTKAMTEALQAHASKLKSMESLLDELLAYQALRAGELEVAKKRFAELKNIPKYRQPWIQWELGEKEKAVQLAKELAQSETKQVHALALHADLLYRSGKTNEAAAVFNTLRPLAAQADLDVPVIQRLKPLAESLQLAGDWRPPLQVPPDAGKRPELASLGPFRWEPSPAPEWSLAGSDGRKIGLRSFQGKPVLLIFYLGHGCVHCVEQLKAFAPVAEAFARQGIELVAVASDAPDQLDQTLEKTEKQLPIRLLADPELATFRAFRAYDDFEKVPLHGTFLIDGRGRVRWQDISHEPFKETEFLLKEARRLLAQPEHPLSPEASVTQARRSVRPLSGARGGARALIQPR